MARPSVALLSSEIIADAAIELIDSGQPFGINALARQLRVRPSSLYNHVNGLDDLVDLVRGQLTARYFPSRPDGAWDDVVAAVLRAQRTMYAQHPHLIPLIVATPTSDAAVIAQYDLLAACLVEAGFPDDEVLSVVAVLGAFAFGLGLDAARPEDKWRPLEETHTIGRLLAHSDRGPARADEVFEMCLGFLLASLRQRVALGDPLPEG